MNTETRQFSLWTGVGVGAVVVGLLVLWLRGAAGSSTSVNADKLYASYVRQYHPEKPNGLAVVAAQTELRAAVARQADELNTTASALSPALPDPYTKTDLIDAGAQIRSDYAAIRQLAVRRSIAIPAALPFERDLDKTPEIRARQLVWLRLVCLSMETCLQAGVSKINMVDKGECFASPTKTDAVFTCDLELEVTWDVGMRLLGGLASADGRGMGLRGVEIVPTSDKTQDKVQRMRLTTQLVTPYREIWELQPSAEAPARDASGATPTGKMPTRRLMSPRP